MLRSRASNTLLPCVLLGAVVRAPSRQTIDDGVMMAKRDLCTGFVYQHDGWDQYWEGTLKRGNGNIGNGHHAERDLDGQLRGHRPAERHRHAAVRVDRTPARACCTA